jgi:hypothetical protein
MAEIGLAAGAPPQAAFWTTRALERAGFRVAAMPVGGPVHLEIVSRDGAMAWRSTLKDQTQDHPTLGALIHYLRAEHPPSTH